MASFGQLRLRSADRGSPPLVTLNTTDLFPLIAIRLQNGRQGAEVVPASIICTSTAAYRWCLLLNPTVAGVAFGYTPVNSSNVEVDAARVNTTTVSGGTQILSGYAQQQQEGGVTIVSVPDFALGTKINGTADVLVLAVQRLTGTTETFYGAIGWHEAT